MSLFLDSAVAGEAEFTRKVPLGPDSAGGVAAACFRFVSLLASGFFGCEILFCSVVGTDEKGCGTGLRLYGEPLSTKEAVGLLDGIVKVEPVTSS